MGQLIGEVFSHYVNFRRQKPDAEAESAKAALVIQDMIAGSSASGSSGRGLGMVNPDRQPTCYVCMCPAECATSTPCGHLFCWDCIASWCAMKATCPLCRTAALPQQCCLCAITRWLRL